MMVLVQNMVALIFVQLMLCLYVRVVSGKTMLASVGKMVLLILAISIVRLGSAGVLESWVPFLLIRVVVFSVLTGLAVFIIAKVGYGCRTSLGVVCAFTIMQMMIIAEYIPIVLMNILPTMLGFDALRIQNVWGIEMLLMFGGVGFLALLLSFPPIRKKAALPEKNTPHQWHLVITGILPMGLLLFNAAFHHQLAEAGLLLNIIFSASIVSLAIFSILLQYAIAYAYRELEERVMLESQSAIAQHHIRQMTQHHQQLKIKDHDHRQHLNHLYALAVKGHIPQLIDSINFHGGGVFPL